jgi:HAD superfamily hydrolase (TIGR01509 family)
MTLRAVIWDVDGTIAETERDGHRVAFNLAFEALRLPWRWDVATYGALLQVSGGYERLLHDMHGRADAPAALREREQLARELHQRKTRAYAELVSRGGMGARPGVLRLIDDCERHGLMLAVATTTSRANVDALFPRLFGAQWPARFRAVVCAEDAPQKKPDPLVFRVALARITCAANEALAIEDSPNGVRAAAAARVPVLAVRSEYFADDDLPGAAWVCGDLNEPVEIGGTRFHRVDVGALRAIHQRHGAAAGVRMA